MKKISTKSQLEYLMRKVTYLNKIKYEFFESSIKNLKHYNIIETKKISF
jgi:hypothetical protein